MISAKIIADSKCPRGNRLTTLEVVMPRYILAEFNTHRMLTRNSASSRAIPVHKLIKTAKENPYIPYAWQREHKGMQGTEYITDINTIELLVQNHLSARDEAIQRVEIETQLGATKQNANRKLEAYIYHKVLVSATEWENFFKLRCPQYNLHGGDNHKTYKSWKEASKLYVGAEIATILDKLQCNKGQADIHMMFLAESIYDAMNESTPKKLKEGEWHIPYGDQINEDRLYELFDNSGGDPDKFDEYGLENQVKEAIRKISVARCARLSYQTLGDNSEINYEKDLELYKQLAKSGHYSPFEHVARVMTSDEYFESVKGKRYQDGDYDDAPYRMEVNGCGWIYNFRGFIQERYLLEQSWKG